MNWIKSFFIGLLEGMCSGLIGADTTFLFLPYILKQKHSPLPPTVINYTEDNRLVQVIYTKAPEPREVSPCIIAKSTKSVGESDFS